MKLSVIIPVYGVEQTLERCVESVLSQLLDDYEVILVDDGSPDHSGAICDSYASCYACVRVIHQENRGLSEARNTGVKEATGAYVTFLDSDDYVGDGTYSPLMDILEKHPEYDILEYPIYEHYGSRRSRRLSFPDREYPAAAYWLEGEAYAHAYACNKVFRRALFDSVRFPANRSFEDVWTLPLLLRYSRTVATTGTGLYYYTENPGGITHLSGGEGLKSLLDAHLNVFDRKAVNTAYYAHLLNIQIDVCEQTGEAPRLPVVPLCGTWKMALVRAWGMTRFCRLYITMRRWIRHSR